jgi:hypothetical protein
MGATIVVIGHPIVIAGVRTAPPELVASGAGWFQASPAFIPVASLSGGAAEATVLLTQGNATIIG